MKNTSSDILHRCSNCSCLNWFLRLVAIADTIKYQREASNQEVADVVKVGIEDVDKTLSTGSRHVSMNAPFVSGEDNSMLDVLENMEETPDSALMAESLRGTN